MRGSGFTKGLTGMSTFAGGSSFREGMQRPDPYGSEWNVGLGSIGKSAKRKR
jgi:hypothetical protein